MFLLEIASLNAELDAQNPVKINYDKHGTFLGIEVYCGGDDVDITTLGPTDGPTTEDNTTITTTTISTTTTTEISNGCDPCHNEIPGKRVYHQECMRFCVCEQNGGVTIEDCDFGLIFNYPTQKCEDTLLSECPYTQWSR